MNTTDFSSDVTTIIGLIEVLQFQELIEVERAIGKIKRSKEMQLRKGLKKELRNNFGKYLLDTTKKYDISLDDAYKIVIEAINSNAAIKKPLYRFNNREWSGNGRRPGWVNQALVDLNLTFEEFKQRFEIDPKVSD